MDLGSGGQQVLRGCVRYYNQQRPHRGLALAIPEAVCTLRMRWRRGTAYYSNPSSRARVTAWVRLAAPSLSRT
jgi:hypothetical protein